MKSLIIRTISGGVFAAVIVAALLLNQYLYAAVALFAMVVMLYEFYEINLGKAYRQSQILNIVISSVVFIATFFMSMYGMMAQTTSAVFGFAFLLIAFFSGLKIFKKGVEYSQRLILDEGFLYIGLPVALLNIPVVGAGEFKGLLILCFFCIIWGSDVGAYMIGCTLGKRGHKMCPSISPNKSWWGFGGGFVFAIIVSCLLSHFGFMDIPIVHACVMAALMHCFGVCGDLFESKWKRMNGVKDSGKIMPGHGGLLDRFDSSIFAFPAAILYLQIFGLI